MKVWRKIDYLKYFGSHVDEEQRSKNMKAMGFDEMETVHDPSLNIKIPAPVPGPQTKKGGKK